MGRDTSSLDLATAGDIHANPRDKSRDETAQRTPS